MSQFQLKIADINTQQEKQSFTIAKSSSRKIQKNRRSAKLNSRNNFVPHGMNWVVVKQAKWHLPLLSLFGQSQAS